MIEMGKVVKRVMDMSVTMRVLMTTLMVNRLRIIVNGTMLISLKVVAGS
jgi:hypothetical protein